MVTLLLLCSSFLVWESALSGHGHRHRHGYRHSRRDSETSSKFFGRGGCSHNIVSLLAFFCGSKSGWMFVDVEGGLEECVCACVCAHVCVCDKVPVIPRHHVCIYLCSLMPWFTGTLSSLYVFLSLPARSVSSPLSLLLLSRFIWYLSWALTQRWIKSKLGVYVLTF